MKVYSRSTADAGAATGAWLIRMMLILIGVTGLLGSCRSAPSDFKSEQEYKAFSPAGAIPYSHGNITRLRDYFRNNHYPYHCSKPLHGV